LDGELNSVGFAANTQSAGLNRLERKMIREQVSRGELLFADAGAAVV
jgi:hypothetical protein